jgi:hypothetical protein
MSHLKVLAGLLMLTCMGCSQTPQANRTLTAPFDVSEAYVASGYMGDGEAGKLVQMRRVTGEMPRPGDTDGMCVKVAYQPGAKGWAGVYWLSPADNFGDKPGNRIQGASKITFWAVGAKGGEIVEFKAGGVSGKENRDSFEKSIGSIVLTNQWKQYTIPLAGQKLSSVLGGFAWVATAADNPGGLAFYVDAIRYE